MSAILSAVYGSTTHRALDWLLADRALILQLALLLFATRWFQCTCRPSSAHLLVVVAVARSFGPGTCASQGLKFYDLSVFHLKLKSVILSAVYGATTHRALDWLLADRALILQLALLLFATHWFQCTCRPSSAHFLVVVAVARSFGPGTCASQGLVLVALEALPRHSFLTLQCTCRPSSVLVGRPWSGWL